MTVRAEPGLADLVARARKGSREAHGTLVRRFERAAAAIAMARTGHPDTAAEVVQEAWLRTFSRLAELREPERFGAWFCATVAHLAIDRARRARGEQLALPFVEPSKAPTPDRETRAAVLAAVRELPEDQRTLILMRFMEDLSYPEIAEALDVPLNRVKWGIQRAFETLRQKLGRHHDLP